jgi:hypothetical protein
MLTGFSKLFEILIFNRLKHHLTSNNILVGEQFGFRDGASTQDAISNLTDTIYKAWRLCQPRPTKSKVGILWN